MRDSFYAAYAFVRKLNGVCVAVASGMIVLMALFTFWETITRYFFRESAVWTYPIVSYMLLYSIYLSVAYALQRGRHVSVEFIAEMVPDRPKRAMERLAHLLGLAFCAVFLVQCWRLFIRNATENQHDVSALSLPLAPASIVLVIGMALTVVTYLFVVGDAFLCRPGQPTIQDELQTRLEATMSLELE